MINNGGCCTNAGIPGLEALKPDKYIKFYDSKVVVVEGSEIIDKIDFGKVRFNYEQYFKSRIVLKKGDVGKMVNYANLGDNVTFLLFKISYDDKAKEEDKFLTYYFIDEPDIKFTVGSAILLTGNSTDRIPVMILDNPSSKYDIQIEMLVACIDDQSDFFDINNIIIPDNSNITFNNMLWTEIKTHVVGESIKVLNKNGHAQLFIRLQDIANIIRQGRILIIDDNALGRIYLDFVTNFNAVQALSVLSWLLEDNNRDLDSTVIADVISPIVITKNVVNNETTINTNIYPYNFFPISKAQILDYIIDSIVDNRDGIMYPDSTNLTIKDSTNIELLDINSLGVYNLIVNIKDIAENNTQLVIVLNVV